MRNTIVHSLLAALPVVRQGWVTALPIIVGCFCCHPAIAKAADAPDMEEKVRVLVRRELQSYPKSTLRDIYKGFFQAEYGPGHIIPERQRAEDYLNRELREMTCVDAIGWQALGLDRQYYRVNLCYVLDGTLPVEALLEAFFESANRARMPEIPSWQAEWNRIAAVIGSMEEVPAGYKKDRMAIDSMLGEGRYIGHHSEAYEAAYQPHYRIVERSLFQELREKYLGHLSDQWPE